MIQKVSAVEFLNTSVLLKVKICGHFVFVPYFLLLLVVVVFLIFLLNLSGISQFSLFENFFWGFILRNGWQK